MEIIQIINILKGKGVDKIVLTKEDVGVEYHFESEQEVVDLFNQLDVKGKTITFSPPNTILDIGTLGEVLHRFTLNDKVLLISKFKLGE